jgi:hypothetical protein
MTRGLGEIGCRVESNRGAKGRATLIAKDISSIAPGSVENRMDYNLIYPGSFYRREEAVAAGSPG